MAAPCALRRGAHPRSRGENVETVTQVSKDAGSSPLTRGKPWVRTWSEGPFGLIPAHAGKTEPGFSIGAGLRAHPRSRGENDMVRLWLSHGKGSSPLTRGKRPRGDRRQRREGLIPAHAGKTPWSQGRRCIAEAHPRSRGENYISGNWTSLTPGSSPLTRGKRRTNESMTCP